MSEGFWQRVKKAAEVEKVPMSTIDVWKHRGYVPAARHYKLTEAAKKIGVTLLYEELQSGIPN